MTPQEHEGSRGGEIFAEWISVPVGNKSMSAYVARPAGQTAPSTVIVGFEMFGLSRYVRAVTERIAGLGYTAVAPDFYHRFGDRIELPPTAEGRERGLELLQDLDRPGVIADVQAVIDYRAKSEGESTGTAMVGLSAGGHIAYAVATRVPLAALVVFYPGWLTDPGIALSRPEPLLELTPQIAGFGTPVLFLVGDGDHLYTPSQLDQIGRRLREDEVRHEMIVYPDTPHGFFCHERDSYRPEAAANAFTRLTDLLSHALPRHK